MYVIPFFVTIRYKHIRIGLDTHSKNIFSSHFFALPTKNHFNFSLPFKLVILKKLYLYRIIKYKNTSNCIDTCIALIIRKKVGT